MSGGHHQTMRVTPSSYDWRQWKDEMASLEKSLL